ncbi:MAG: discoidin domain-containing protein [Puniceicoccales bacterium]|jgi:hypothetical protein|nr:discoidin domain-containing protein [Puniceicoccales bacterium]
MSASRLQADPDFKDPSFGEPISEKASIRICSSGDDDMPELHACLVRGPVMPNAFVTASEQLPWVILDLKQSRQITGIHIRNTPGKNGAKNTGLTVEFSSDRKTWTSVFQGPDTAPAEWKIDLLEKNTPTRYVRIGLKQDNPRVFRLSRVTVYAK